MIVAKHVAVGGGGRADSFMGWWKGQGRSGGQCINWRTLRVCEESSLRRRA